MDDVIKIVKSFQESGLLLKTIEKTIENEANKHRGAFLSMLLVTLGAILLRNFFSGKWVVRSGDVVISVVDGINKKGF